MPPDREEAANWEGSWDGNWILPANSWEIVSAVRTAAGGRFSLEVELPAWVAVEQVEKDSMILVHLVNYRRGNKLSALPFEVELDQGSRVRNIRLISPDSDSVENLEFSQSGNRCRFIVPRLEVYDVVVIDHGRK